jgi:hypothetical protein
MENRALRQRNPDSFASAPGKPPRCGSREPPSFLRFRCLRGKKKTDALRRRNPDSFASPPENRHHVVDIYNHIALEGVTLWWKTGRWGKGIRIRPPQAQKIKDSPEAVETLSSWRMGPSTLMIHAWCEGRGRRRLIIGWWSSPAPDFPGAAILLHVAFIGD